MHQISPEQITLLCRWIRADKALHWPELLAGIVFVCVTVAGPPENSRRNSAH